MQMLRHYCPRLVNLGLCSFDKPLSDWWGPDSSNVCVHFHRLTSSLRNESRAWMTADFTPHHHHHHPYIHTSPLHAHTNAEPLMLVHAKRHTDTHKVAHHSSNSWGFPSAPTESGREAECKALAHWLPESVMVKLIGVGCKQISSSTPSHHHLMSEPLSYGTYWFTQGMWWFP